MMVDLEFKVVTAVVGSGCWLQHVGVVFAFQAVCVCVNLDKLMCVLVQEYEVRSESSIFQSW